MTDVNTLVADPSAATAEATPTEHSPSPINLSELSKEERQSWRDTGKLPEPKTEEAESSDQSEETTSEAKAENAAESEAAKPQDKTQGKKPQAKLTAEQRIQQLTAKNKELATQLADRTREREEATKPPAKVEQPKAQPKALEAPVKPKIDDKNADGTAKYKTFEEFDDAKDKYVEELTDYKTKAALRQAEAERAQKASEQVLDQQVTEARKQYDDFDAIAGPVLTSVMENAEVHLAVKQAINNSPVLPHLLYGLGGNQQQLDNLVKLSKTDPIEAIKRLGAIEDLVIQELAKARAGAGKDAAADKAADADADTDTEDAKDLATLSKDKNPATPITRVGKPPSEVGGRGTSQEDPAVAAARSGDVRGVFSEWNRKAKEGSIR